jgi:multidrug efflux system membrane fusion protein
MRKSIAIVTVSCAAAAAAYLVMTGAVTLSGPLAFLTAPFRASAAAPRPAAIAVPVSAVPAERRDVPIYLTGLGTVQAFNSVLVKSRVDGQMVKINFAEGKDVRAGAVLVEIDPRPYEAALEQAKANKLKDEAQRDNARLDVERHARLIATNASSKQQLDTSRALLAQLEASVLSDQAAIDMARTQLDYAKIHSPIEGRAGAARARNGMVS